VGNIVGICSGISIVSVGQRPSPLFKSDPEGFDFTAKKVQIFLFLYTIPFKPIAIGQNVSGHDVYKGKASHSYGVGIAQSGLLHLFGDQKCIRHQRFGDIVPKTIDLAQGQYFPIMGKIGGDSLAQIS